MRLDTFLALRDWLVENTALQSSRYVTVEKKLFIFIWIAKSRVSTVIHQSNLTVVARQYHSKRLLLLLLLYTLTYISCFHEVITALNILYQSNTPTASKILDNYQFAPYFSNYLSALDSTHVEMHVPVVLQPMLRARSSQVILA
jgi:hypothetical protein